MLKCYTVIIVFLMILFVLFGMEAIFIKSNTLHSLKRPGYGENVDIVPLEAKIRNGNEVLRKKITVRIQPQALTNAQKEAFIKECRERIATEILGRNKDKEHILYNLTLPKQDSIYPIQIDWASTDSSFIEEDGTVHRLELNKPKKIYLSARFTLYDIEQIDTYQLTLLPSEKEGLERELNEALETIRLDLNNNTNGDKLILPKKFVNNTSLEWYAKRGIPLFPLAAIGILSIFFLYKRRYYRMEKEIKRYREAMRREYPEFVNKIVLLLNAGLVITSALERVSLADESKTEHPLMEAMKEISDKVRESNASFSQELKIFARTSGMRELMRFSAIVCDNLEKGNSLAEKLETEGELIWIARKKQVEEEGRKVETKLLLPLMMLLLILVIITISPVLIEI